MSPSDPQLPFDRPPEGRRPRRVDLDGEVSLKFKEHAGLFEERPANLSSGGMFVRTRSPQPPGTTFDFELTLQDEPRVIHGIGEVAWVREEDQGFDRPPGMGVRFLSLEPESRALVEGIVVERLREEEREEVPPPASTALTEAPPVPPAAPEPEPEPEREPRSAPEAPLGALRPPDPGRYAYARSYQGAAVDRRSRRRPLLALLLVLLALVMAVAGLSLLFPETAVRLLLGEEEGGGEPAVAAARSGAGPDPELDPGRAEGERPEATEPGEPSEGEGTGEGEEQLGFFEPTVEGPSGPEAPSEAAPPAVPAPAPVPAPEPDAAPDEARFSRVLNVIWEERSDGELVVTVFLDGVLEEWDYTVTRLGVPPPRALVVIQGVEEPFPRREIPVGTELVERIRLGFHPERPESELHLVLDLADPEAEVLRSESEGREIRLHVGRALTGS